MLEFKTGNIIDGRYGVISKIGEGGMGAVLQVKDYLNDSLVALKYCRDREKESLRRFSREVRIISSISHNNVIPIYDSNLEYDPPYFTMPLAKCSTLDLIPRIRDDIEEGLRIFVEICNGIQAIHSTGSFHRDINPRNALILPNNTVVVSDLGLAKIENRDTTILTGTCQILGTQIYMAPEQLFPEGCRDSDARTDVFQLGKTLQHFLTGERPIILFEEKLDPGLAYIIRKATRTRPEERYQTVEELLDAILDYQYALDPQVNPKLSFQKLLEEANELLEQGKYRPENVKQMIKTIYYCKDDHSVFLDIFDKVPDKIVMVLSGEMQADFELILEQYSLHISNHIASYPFVYAENVANKMLIVLEYAKDLEIKKYAYKSIICAAIDLNRFKVIQAFNKVLTSITNNSDAIAMADVLRVEIERYSKIADNITKIQLHPALHSVWEEAVSRGRKLA